MPDSVALDAADNASPATNTCAVWDRIAGFWDDHLGEGNDFQRTLVMPTTDRLLAGALGPIAGKKILDACCGNGNYARKLAARGAIVTAFDGSNVFIDRAKTRAPSGPAAAQPIDYHVIDATNATALESLAPAAPFDAAVCSMAMMDLSDIAPLLRAVRQLLAPDGVFIWSVCHPAFNATSTRLTAEFITESNGRCRQRFGIATETYLTPREEASEGIINQPEPHPMFHRPIHLLLAECFAAGFVIDGFEEPAYPPGTSAKSAFAWAKRPEIPPVLVVRLRAPAATLD